MNEHYAVMMQAVDHNLPIPDADDQGKMLEKSASDNETCSARSVGSPRESEGTSESEASQTTIEVFGTFPSTGPADGDTNDEANFDNIKVERWDEQLGRWMPHFFEELEEESYVIEETPSVVGHDFVIEAHPQRPPPPTYLENERLKECRLQILRLLREGDGTGICEQQPSTVVPVPPLSWRRTLSSAGEELAEVVTKQPLRQTSLASALATYGPPAAPEETKLGEHIVLRAQRTPLRSQAPAFQPRSALAAFGGQGSAISASWFATQAAAEQAAASVTPRVVRWMADSEHDNDKWKTWQHLKA